MATCFKALAAHRVPEIALLAYVETVPEALDQDPNREFSINAWINFWATLQHSFLLTSISSASMFQSHNLMVPDPKFVDSSTSFHTAGNSMVPAIWHSPVSEAKKHFQARRTVDNSFKVTDQGSKPTNVVGVHKETPTETSKECLSGKNTDGLLCHMPGRNDTRTVAWSQMS